MSDLPWFQFFASDWLAGTRGLSAVETGIYITLIASMYDRETPLPNDADRLSRLCGCSARQFKAALQRLMDEGKVIDREGQLWNTRVEEQLQLRAAKSEKAKQSANARHSGKIEQKQEMKIAVAEPEQCSKPANQKPEARSQKEAEQSTAPPETGNRAALCVEVGKKITDAMGVTNDPRWIGNWSAVTVWLAKGYDPDLDILPTVLATVDRLKRINRAMPSSLNYFEKAIGDNHRRRLETGQVTQKPNVELCILKAGTAEFREWIAFWKKEGRSTKFLEKQPSITVPTIHPPKDSPDHERAA